MTAGGIGDGPRAAGHGLYYSCMALTLVAFVVLGAISWAERDRPRYWGTFTEESTTCDAPPRRHCTSIGRWVSDDATIVKNEIRLDGSVERGQTVRASYTPGGPMGDDVNNIVHTETWTGAGLWFPWVGAGVIVAVTWLQRRRWKGAAERRELSRRRSPTAGTTPSRAGSPPSGL